MHSVVKRKKMVSRAGKPTGNEIQCFSELFIERATRVLNETRRSYKTQGISLIPNRFFVLIFSPPFKRKRFLILNKSDGFFVSCQKTSRKKKHKKYQTRKIKIKMSHARCILILKSFSYRDEYEIVHFFFFFFFVSVALPFLFLRHFSRKTGETHPKEENNKKKRAAETEEATARL